MASGCGMRITKISVEKLFGIFDHEIPLNLDGRITIIHGPNGYGKTVILKMLSGLFKSKYADFKTIPYESFSVGFDDGRRLEVQKDWASGKGRKPSDLAFRLHSNEKGKSKLFHSKRHTQNDRKDRFGMEIALSSLARLVPGLVQTSDNKWIYKATDEVLSAEEVLERFGDQFSAFFAHPRKEPEWLIEIKEEIDIYFIESQRLLSFPGAKSSNSYQKSRSQKPLQTVKAYSDDIVQEVKDRLADYASVSQALDRSFPVRVLNPGDAVELTDEALQEKLKALEHHRYRLVQTGLLEQEQEQNLQFQRRSLDKSTKNILAVYIEDTEKKLNTFGDLLDKIELFKRIINSKLSYKEIRVDRAQGFIFTIKYPNGHNAGSDTVSPMDLSSGEQHELVLLYELLFKVQPKSLVLIDEPELSLHVGWQVNFLRDLQEIAKLSDIDVLIATHSPSLIHDRWDLTVELKGVS
jgi:predicted ATP-binding protein involved in virulence